MNTITLTGNVVADPERIVYHSDKSMATFRIANNEFVKGQNVSNGFFEVVVFGPQSINVLNSLHKGDRIVITGRIQHSTYEKPDGTRGGRIKIIAQVVAMSLEFHTLTASKTQNPAPEEEAE